MATRGIEAHIASIGPTTIFTTRDVLKYGKRSAVDQCLHVMVREGVLRRLARGVFVQDPNVHPTIEEIAQIKAAAFGKKIFKHATDILHEVGSLRQLERDETKENAKPRTKLFAINGHSSGFESICGPVRYKGIAQRKTKLCESQTGEKVCALWHLGDSTLIDKAVRVVFRSLNRGERFELRNCSSFMPGWLNDMFVDRFAGLLAA
jgi:hypothetical protein